VIQNEIQVLLYGSELLQKETVIDALADGFTKKMQLIFTTLTDRKADALKGVLCIT